jgi:phosphoribosylamine---glycine ligase
MKNIVLVVDGGGRGSALVDKYAQSPHVKKIIAVPGNDLMKINTNKSVETYQKIKTTNTVEILKLCKDKKVNLVDVAQDNAIEAGLANLLSENNIPIVGPTKEAGEIEWNKAWAREFGQKYNLPQPFFKVCLSEKEGIKFLKDQPDQKWFVKTAYLAEGKGALPAKNNKEAVERVKEIKKFGKAGKVFLIEKWLKGDDDFAEEFSTFVFSDGKNYKVIGSAQDHKRALNYDEGENTGGMGCSSPPLVLTPKILKEIENIFDKTIKGLKNEGRPYKGVLYLGGMIIKLKGKLTPYVIEFNARWGDPEAQVILPGVTNDLFEMSMDIARGNIKNLKIKTDGKARVVVTGASKGYPGNYDEVKNKQIYGLKEARKVKGIKIYGAGIKEENGKHYAFGGRLFYIVGEGKNVVEAKQRAYEAMSLISIEGNNLHFRTDIGWRDVERLRK